MVSFALHGIGVSGGIAIGRAQLVSHATLEVAHYALGAQQVTAEVDRFAAAVAEVRRELEGLRGSLSGGETPGEFGAFLDVHSMILNDPTLAETPKQIITDKRCNAEWALTLQIGVLTSQFDQIDDPYLRERRADVIQVGERVLKRLMGRPGVLPAPRAEEQTILVAHDLSPADVLQFKHHRYAGFLTDLGGITSHTAIVARSLNVPAVVATHHARQLIREGEMLIIDGGHHVVIINPDRAVLAEYRLRQEELGLARQKLRRLKSKPAETIDGIRVHLNANIELPEDIDAALANGAEGVGLFRSEFLFLNRPALGLRAVRFCLAEPRLFHTQLRAILRASHYGKVRILIPMLASAAEIEQTLAVVARARQSLREQDVPFDPAVPVGGMIEIPAAVIAIGAFLRRLDFLSVGTNDLIQYTLAVDRADEAVSHLYDPLHPAVIKLLAMAIQVGAKYSLPVSVCGE